MEADPPGVVEAQLGHADGARLCPIVAGRHPHTPAQIEIGAAHYGIVEVDLDVHPATVEALEVAHQRGVVFGDEQRIAEVHRAAVQRFDARGNAGLVDGCEEGDEPLCRCVRDRCCGNATERLLMTHRIAGFRRAATAAEQRG